MDFLIVTGLSGAGKSQAIHALEDFGYFCIDNIPPELLPKFYDLCLQSDEKGKYAAVIDIRSKDTFCDVFTILEALNEKSGGVRLLFLDACDPVIIRRYKETRRRHPLMGEKVDTLQAAVAKERELLLPAKEKADFVIDTSMTSGGELKERISELFLKTEDKRMTVTVMSFGFKYGIPADADLVFDVRCLPNPFYIEALKAQTGLDAPVADYIFGFEQSAALLRKLEDLLAFLIPLYIEEGKSHLVVAVGCTGGRHRSVAFAQRLYESSKSKNVNVSVTHRDCKK